MNSPTVDMVWKRVIFPAMMDFVLAPWRLVRDLRQMWKGVKEIFRKEGE